MSVPDPTEPAVRTPHDVLDHYYRAMLDMSADDLADLYAPDAVHEFPFTAPGFPARFEGREAVRAGYRAAWGAGPAWVREIRRIATYETADPQVLVAEHVVVGTLRQQRTEFTVPGLLILRVRDGLLILVRDYMDGPAVADIRPEADPGTA